MTFLAGPLGQKTAYIENYSPELLFPVSRSYGREKIGLSEDNLPFFGVDIWNGFELSWLNAKGKPVIAVAEFTFPCDTPNIVESKSFKLYLNSLNQERFETIQEVETILESDLSKVCEGEVKVKLYSLGNAPVQMERKLDGIFLDELDVDIEIYEPAPELLKTSSEYVQETLCSNLLKSNCLATGQPDWGAVQISYSGLKIDHEGLLKYIISYRRHSGFAEHCVEQIYQDISKICKPEQLTVYARYTRRGGLDINPYRSNFEKAFCNIPILRQ